MKITESIEALQEALLSIAKSAEERGLKTEVKCFAADNDLVELEQESPRAALVAGELTVKSDGEDKIILECALSVIDGEVSSEEMLSEVNTLRESMKDLCNKFDESGSADGMFNAVAKEHEVPMPEEKVYDNKKFYIYGGIAVAVVLILVLLLG